MGDANVDPEFAANAVTALRPDAARRRDQVWPCEMAQRFRVDDLASSVHDPPVAILPPLPPGPADAQVIRLIEGGIGV